MKQKLLKTIALTVLMMGGVNSAWAGDFIDDATTIKIRHSGATELSSITTEDAEGKKVLKFTPTTNADAYIEFEFSSGYSITPGQVFGIIEWSANGVTSNKNRFRYWTIDGTELEEGNAGSVQTTTENGRTVVLCNYIANNHNTESKQLAPFFATNVDKTSLSVTKVGIHVGVSAANTETVFTSVGVYTLGEILTKYSSFCTSHDWQYIKVDNPRVEINGTGGNTIKTKDANIGSPTKAQTKLFIKSLGLSSMPVAYTNIHLRYLNPSEVFTEDVFSSEWSGEQKLLLNFDYMYKMPTTYDKMDQFDQNQKFHVFFDGIAPTSVTPKHTTNGNWGAYTRSFKAGYNSLILPMKYLTTYDTDNLTFYKVNSFSDGIVSFTKISADDIKNNAQNYKEEPLIVHANRDGLYTLVGRDADNTLTGYKPKNAGGSGNTVFFVGSYVYEVPSGDYLAGTDCTNYGITSDGTKFAQMGESTKTTYYRAFLSDKRSTSEGVKTLSLSFDDGNGTTDIISVNDVHGMGTQANTGIYNLAGQRIQTPNKGLYIVNGKKVIMK